MNTLHKAHMQSPITFVICSMLRRLSSETLTKIAVSSKSAAACNSSAGGKDDASCSVALCFTYFLNSI